MSHDADNSPTIAKLREKNWRTCASKGAERDWFCNADDFEAAILDLEANLAKAAELLREFGACDPYSGQPYDGVHEFLRLIGVEPRS